MTIFRAICTNAHISKLETNLIGNEFREMIYLVSKRREQGKEGKRIITTGKNEIGGDCKASYLTNQIRYECERNIRIKQLQISFSVDSRKALQKK